LGSCKKFLDKKQNAQLIVPSSLDDLQKLLDDEGTMNFSRTPSYGETSADDYYMTDDYYDLVGSVLGESYQHYYLWEKYFDVNARNDWGTAYQPIYNSNLVLDIIKNIPHNASGNNRWENIKGSALFYRSYYFLSLLWNYAKAYDSSTADKDLGIALRLTSDFNIPSVRASNEECYSQVLKDTKEAIPLLPNYAQNKLRPSRAAAYGLLARCYLSMRDYKSALLYADSCLQLENQLMNYNDDEDISNSETPFKEFNKETVFYTRMNNNGLIFNTAQGASGIDTVLLNSYDSNDLRKNLYFEPYGVYKIFRGNYTSDIYNCFSGIATDEIYLIRGESYIRTGHIQEGLMDINTLLLNRYVTGTYTPLTNLTKEEALEFCFKERRKELLMRGLRWMDLKRLNMEGRNIIPKRIVHGKTYILPPNSNFYALPIPDDIIKLSGMPQGKS
jgi:hypothetical protein